MDTRRKTAAIVAILCIANALDNGHEIMWSCNSNQVLAVTNDWLNVSCGTANVAYKNSTNAIDRSLRWSSPHGEPFDSFAPWRGDIANLGSGLVVDFLGVIVPESLFCNAAFSSAHNKVAHAIRNRQCSIMSKVLPQSGPLSPRVIQTAWPVVSEEYWEYSDVLAAAADYAKETSESGGVKRPFAFVELGAGYGHWSFSSQRALTQKLGADFNYSYLLLDVVGSLVPAVHRIARLNNVSLNGVGKKLDFHVGYISYMDSDQGENDNQITHGNMVQTKFAKGWGTGKSIDDLSAVLKTVTLKTLLSTHNFPECIDMVDIDILGNEYPALHGRKGIFYGGETIQLLSQRVRRVHIGLHKDTPEAERGRSFLAHMFEANGWRVVSRFGVGNNIPTPRGPVDFSDGVLSAINEHPPACQ